MTYQISNSRFISAAALLFFLIELVLCPSASSSDKTGGTFTLPSEPTFSETDDSSQQGKSTAKSTAIRTADSTEITVECTEESESISLSTASQVTGASQPVHLTSIAELSLDQPFYALKQLGLDSPGIYFCRDGFSPLHVPTEDFLKQQLLHYKSPHYQQRVQQWQEQFSKLLALDPGTPDSILPPALAAEMDKYLNEPVVVMKPTQRKHLGERCLVLTAFQYYLETVIDRAKEPHLFSQVSQKEAALILALYKSGPVRTRKVIVHLYPTDASGSSVSPEANAAKRLLLEELCAIMYDQLPFFCWHYYQEDESLRFVKEARSCYAKELVLRLKAVSSLAVTGEHLTGLIQLVGWLQQSEYCGRFFHETGDIAQAADKVSLAGKHAMVKYQIELLASPSCQRPLWQSDKDPQKPCKGAFLASGPSFTSQVLIYGDKPLACDSAEVFRQSLAFEPSRQLEAAVTMTGINIKYQLKQDGIYPMRHTPFMTDFFMYLAIRESCIQNGKITELGEELLATCDSKLLVHDPVNDHIHHWVATSQGMDGAAKEDYDSKNRQGYMAMMVRLLLQNIRDSQ
ncbi:hypothetical protein ACWJJH_03535 [Endozoicomonadaceae bacterium StTr2]